MKIEYHRAAEEEILEIGEHYMSIGPELGQKFASEFRFCLRRVRESPLMFEEIQRGIRRCAMQQFPYSIYFRMPDANTVRIIVVRHHSRRPGLGMRRQ
jgi:plasmid stabilization system protein ParE